MKKANIFFDFDGMKFDTVPAIVAYLNQRYGMESKMSDYLESPPLELVVNKYRPDLKVSYDEVYQDLGYNFGTSIAWHKTVLPMEGMCQVISLAAKKYNIWTVTARQKVERVAINYLINKYIPGCINGVHCVWDYVEGKGYVEISKKDFIENFKGSKIAFFDDSPKEIRRTQGIITSYLFDPDKLHDDKTDIIHRARSFEEIGNILGV